VNNGKEGDSVLHSGTQYIHVLSGTLRAPAGFFNEGSLAPYSHFVESLDYWALPPPMRHIFRFAIKEARSKPAASCFIIGQGGLIEPS
jgi:hypothetical protein